MLDAYRSQGAFLPSDLKKRTLHLLLAGFVVATWVNVYSLHDPTLIMMHHRSENCFINSVSPNTSKGWTVMSIYVYKQNAHEIASWNLTITSPSK